MKTSDNSHGAHPLLTLKHQLSSSFSFEEIKSLCFDLGVIFEDLPGETHTLKAQSLIEYFYRRDQVSALLLQLQHLRPNYDWSQFLPIGGDSESQSISKESLRISLFGKRGVGKTATIEALQDTILVQNFRGIRLRFSECSQNLQKISYSELQQITAPANLILLLLDEEPRKDEVSAFERLLVTAPETPKIVFVNKWDRWQIAATSSDLARLRQKIWQVMNRFVNARNDIVYGSARIYDRQKDRLVDQTLPELLDRVIQLGLKDKK